jgi:DNA-binding transcriptional MerR regulator
MARLSISEAARQAGISRQYLHKLIKNGTVTASTDEMGTRYIEDSELLRAFEGRLPKVKPPSAVPTNATGVVYSGVQRITPPEFPGLQVEVQLLREQLRKTEERHREQVQEYRQREQRLLDQVDRLTEAVKQIEHRPADPQPVQAPPAPTPRRGLFARLFGRS